MPLIQGREFEPTHTARCKTNLNGQLSLTEGKIYAVEDLTDWDVVLVENDKGIVQTYEAREFGPLQPIVKQTP